jgi:hypothetical protein
MRKTLIFLAAVAVLIAVGFLAKHYVAQNRTPTERIVWDSHALEKCLPPGLTLSTQFYDEDKMADRGAVPPKPPTTVKRKLLSLGAYCQDGTIYDSSGREIKLHWVWEPPGYKPTPEQEELFRQRAREEQARLQEMEKTYTVVRMLSTHEPQ